MHNFKHYQIEIERGLSGLSFPANPAELYDPVRYMLALGGKRIRPAMLMMSNEMFGCDSCEVLGPALGIEVFHNFTLLHDDIMDNAPLRRAQSTVHVKWNPDIAILSGDAMFVKSCQLMMAVPQKHLESVMDHFLITATQVCEGQQMDMNFESINEVKISQYLEMISLKTGVLLGASMKIGALLAGASVQQCNLAYDFGKNLGVAFQLHDDILDLYGDAVKTGKKTGGDILAGKKTILVLKALELGGEKQGREIIRLLNEKEKNQDQKVETMLSIFDSLNVRVHAENVMENYFDAAMNALSEISVDANNKKEFFLLAENLMVRES
ncbi:MAG: polyprenyl synthetase family protein [Bacteroidetes bacterium]|nr:MAG: polyprenyl synthetase family protein [Bacteroidota bacterium]REK03385.1 MAG: polyprenyl synthetase family protein [Bacteroidota bacterium]REK34503.1 MAG: polyprenyl synthetase family protein [Bacteroidota bacterium]REK50379.1 MAG: polyprenyl synthetase family protein [Bacteroidota bacterium]